MRQGDLPALHVCTRPSARVAASARRCAVSPTYNMSGATFLRAGAAALAGGLAIGTAWAFFNVITYIFTA